ncbi:MAG: FAD-dependent monooxygenase, partial [Pedobacter sp.]
MEKEKSSWTACQECKGHGKKSKGLTNKAKLRYQQALAQFEEQGGEMPVAPKGHLHTCSKCGGSGLIRSENPPAPDQENYPHVAIIGGGIGGVALAAACLHRGIPFSIYERDH